MLHTKIDKLSKLSTLFLCKEIPTIPLWFSLTVVDDNDGSEWTMLAADDDYFLLDESSLTNRAFIRILCGVVGS